MLAFGTLTACSGGSSAESTTTAKAQPFPQLARYIADMKSPDGKPMTIGISADGGELAAYACNGSEDEAWFFGNHTDGEINSRRGSATR